MKPFRKTLPSVHTNMRLSVADQSAQVEAEREARASRYDLEEARRVPGEFSYRINEALHEFDVE